MIDLDDPQVYLTFDPSNVREHIRGMPYQCLKAWERALDFKVPPDYAHIDNVCILGMGGSAIGGSLLSDIGKSIYKIPVIVNREYDLPAFVNSKTLVIASSYSGNTEETLSAFNQAMRTPAKKLVITTGGRLKSIAEQHNIPVFIIDYASPPRFALTHSLFPLLAISQNIGLIHDISHDVEEAIQVMQDMQIMSMESSPTVQNRAKQLAVHLYNRLAIIYGAGILSSVAQRWKTQINENSKAWAFYEVFPELNHNAVVGYLNPEDLAQKICVIMLRSPNIHSRVLLTYEAASELLNQADVHYEVIETQGDGVISQVMSLIQFGDWVSYYLAMLYRTDPAPIKAIEQLKRRLC